MDVAAVITRLNYLGLDVQKKTKSGHYKVYDPKTGAWLFDVAGTPSDPNWYYNIARNLRRIGLSLEDGKHKFKKIRGRTHPAVDLEALQRAQEAARAAGEREPQLADLDEAPSSSPLWKRSNVSGMHPLNHEAEREVIDNMVARADTARVKYIRGRLQNFMMEKGDELAKAARKRFPNTRPGLGASAEFARIAMYEVAPARDMRAWKTESAAQQAVTKFLKDETSGLSVWALALVEATMDHMNGMKWGTYEIPEKIELLTDEERDRIAKRLVETEEETNRRVNELNAEAEKIAASYAEDEPKEAEDGWTDSVEPMPDPEKWSRSPVRELPSYKERYIEQLLKMLESGNHSDEVIAMEVLPRLDKLLLVEE